MIRKILNSSILNKYCKGRDTYPHRPRLGALSTTPHISDTRPYIGRDAFQSSQFALKLYSDRLGNLNKEMFSKFRNSELATIAIALDEDEEKRRKIRKQVRSK